VIYALKLLEECGLIERTGDRHGGHGGSTVWRVFESPSSRGAESSKPEVQNETVSLPIRDKELKTPSWAPEDLTHTVCFALSRVPELYGNKRTQSQDGKVWRLLRSIWKEGCEEKRDFLLSPLFWSDILSGANWGPPKSGSGQAGYGYRISIEVEKALAGIKSESQKISAAEQHRRKLQESFGEKRRS